jgi:release factor glutamine methyltransferase
MTEELWTILKVLSWTQQRFAERGLGTPRLDAELLLAKVVGRDRVGLYAHFDQPLSASELSAYRELIRRRFGGEPVAYLIGEKEFHSLLLSVDKHVLVPRPDTETLVDTALSLIGQTGRVLDVGTGSGAVALALKKERPGLEVVAIDQSKEAARMATQNAERLALELDVRIGDLFEPVAEDAPFDLVVSNPPYIPTPEIATLSREVQREPRAALDGGEDGLFIIRRLIAEAPNHLRPGGALALEIGAGQAKSVSALFDATEKYETVETARDLQSIERVIFAHRNRSENPRSAAIGRATP